MDNKFRLDRFIEQKQNIYILKRIYKIINFTMNSALLPSPLLTPLSALTKQQQKILKGYNTHLNMQKYKKGKALYLAYIQAKSNPKTQRYEQFVQQFKQKNYVSKVLLISSMKYYRDIKQILIGGPADAGIQQDKRWKYIQIDIVLTQLDKMAQFDQKTQQFMKNTEKAEIELAKTIQLRQQKQQSKQIKAQQKFNRSNNNNINNINSKINNLQKTTNKKQLNKAKPLHLNLAKTLTYDSQVQQITPITYNISPTITPNQHSFSLSRSNSQTQKSQKQLQYIKLIKVKMQNNNDKNMSMSTKSQRMHSNSNNNNYLQINKKQGASTYRGQGNNKFLSNLSSNQLYQKRYASLSNKSKSQKSQKNLYLKPTVTNKYHKNTKKRTPVGSSICDKLLQCLRYLGVINGNASEKRQIQNQKINDKQQRKLLISSKVSTKTQMTNVTKKINTK